MSDALISQADLDRVRALMAAADQRPSNAGFGSVTVYEISKMGGWMNTKDKDAPARPSIRIIPLVLRETRAYWARKGLGSAPDCRSINGLEPIKDKDHQPQAETCASCPWNKFGTAENGGKGKKCKTKAVLFAMEVAPDGSHVGPVVLRFSMANRNVPDMILAADRAAKAMNLPRFLTYWEVKTKVSKGAVTDFIHFAPECVGKVPVEKATSTLDLMEQVVSQADTFLSASPRSDETAD